MKRITVTIDPDDYASFQLLAQQGHVTVSWLIRRSMREFLERQEAENFAIVPIGPVRRVAGG